ncbi:AraC family ligand binding domain-containing protein [Oryzifoliimicrobium ureilyticus]|uniref:AraC family ligand binding domain-containing protein n=1 Tax=Oryzifoliimicrobium ureilyticus TaxID=3113724 RepID=UPI00307630F1
MTAENFVKVWREPDLHDAEMLKGAYAHHAYPSHSHEELSLGLVIDGAIRLKTRRAEGIAKAGSFVLINSDEIHQGAPAVKDGWRCRTIHLLPSAIISVAEQILDRSVSELPQFDGPTFEDPELSGELLALHRRAEQGSSVLERQTYISVVIARLLVRHSAVPTKMPKLDGDEPLAVTRARDYLDEHLAEKITLDQLSLIAGLPPFRVCCAPSSVLLV